MINETLERQVIELVAADRIFITASSMDNKLKRIRPKLAQAIELPGNQYSGQRVYARIESEPTTEKARSIREAVDTFSEKYPKYGQILNGMIEETRASKEVDMYFGVNPGCRLTADDYLGVMANLGFTEAQSRNLYEPLINTSRSISKKRDEERSVLIG